MGQKINPNGFRYGVNKNWKSRWVAKNGIATGKIVVEDEAIRNYFFNNFVYAKPKNSSIQKINAQIDRIEIERVKDNVNIFIYCGQPALINAHNPDALKAMTLAINKIVGRDKKVKIDVIAHANVNWSARIVAREIADDIEKRVSFRNAQKKAISKAMANGVKGIKTVVSGRLGGVDMARHEGYSKGVVPLTTLRADLDYAIEKAHTVSGIIGVKVWINRGIILQKGLNNQVTPTKPVSNSYNNSNNANNGNSEKGDASA